MSIYKIRILAEGEQEIFRDIEIKSAQNLEELHEIVAASFGFDGTQMASFYKSDEKWNRGQEITLFDVDADKENEEQILVMENVKINTVVNCLGDHLLYVYDFFNEKNFFLELIEIKLKEEQKFYPRVVYSQGELDIENSMNNEEFDDFSSETFDDEFNNDDDFDEFDNNEFDDDNKYY